MTSTENSLGERDIEIDLSTEAAQAVADLNAEFAAGPSANVGLAGWFDENGDKIDGLVDLGVVTPVHSSDEMGVIGGPLAVGSGFEFEGQTLLDEEGPSAAVIADWINEAAALTGLAADQIAFHQIEPVYSGFSSGVDDRNFFETPNGTLTAAVVFYADMSTPEDVAHPVFSVNGAPTPPLVIRHFIA